MTAAHWMRISLPYATFAIVTAGGKVVDAAPIAKWTVGKDERDVAAYFRRRGADITVFGGAT